MWTLVWIAAVPLTLAGVAVYSPQSLKEELMARYPGGHIPAVQAPFGNPPLGASIVGKVYIGEEERPGSCGNLKHIPFHDDPTSQTSPVLLVFRRNCSYSNRVKHSQSIGAKAVLVVHNQLDNVEGVRLMPGADTRELLIPSFLIGVSDGRILKTKIQQGEEVLVTLDFQAHSPSNFVEYTIWLSSGSLETLEFLARFAGIAQSFSATEAVASPHFVLWYCSTCKAQNFTAAAPNCVSSGRYCAPDPDGNGVYTGRDVVLEDLRQICLLSTAKDAWFGYQRGMWADCWKGTDLEECSYSVMARWDSLDSSVRKCVSASFSNNATYEADNSLLRAEQEAWHTHGSGYYPSIIINNYMYHGYWEPQKVKEAICSEFDSPPTACQDSVTENVAHSVGMLTGVMVLFGVLVLLSLVLCVSRLVMKREMQREMKLQVNASVSQYISLSNSSFVAGD